MRFRLVAGYLAAALATVAIVLLADVTLAGGRTEMELLRNLATTAAIYGAYGLGFTLALGLVGLLLLRFLRGGSLFAYAATGAALGFLTAGLGDGFSGENSFLVIFTIAGAAAASVFYRVAGANGSRNGEDGTSPR
jgi:hypothetical protein